MKYLTIIVLVWVLCGIIDLIIFPIRDEYNHLDPSLKEELLFYENRMGVGYHIILWIVFIIYAAICGPINLYRSWMNTNS